MKAILILAVSMFSTAFVIAQVPNVEPITNVEEVGLTPPVFFGPNHSQSNSSTEMFKAYLMENVSYPERALQCKKEGTELVQYTISAQGKITDIKIINSVCGEIDKEIRSALESSDCRWLPALRNGKADDYPDEISLAFCCTNESSKPLQVVFKERAIEYFGRANKALFVKHDAEKAMALYSQGIKYLPYDESLRLMRGMCRYELGDKEGANNDWDRLKISGVDPIEMNKYLEQMKGFKGYNELMVRLNNEFPK